MPSVAPRSAAAPAVHRLPRNPAAVSRADSPGHPPHLKQLLPPEQVTQTVPLVLSRTVSVAARPCRVEHGLEDPEPTRFQVAELPDLKAKVTEYQRHSRTCPCCGQVNQAPLPEDFPTHSIGPGLAALMAYLGGASRPEQRPAASKRSSRPSSRFRSPWARWPSWSKR